MDKRFLTTTSVREVREDLDILWKRALAAGAPRSPPSRVTFSTQGWLDFMSDPEIRQVGWRDSMLDSVETLLGAEVAIDHNQTERFKTELTGDSER